MKGPYLKSLNKAQWICRYIYIQDGLTLKECREAQLVDIYIQDGLSPKWCREAHQDKALSPCPLMVNGYQGLRFSLYPNNSHSPLKTSHANS